jgi:hypothetical protein
LEAAFDKAPRSLIRDIILEKSKCKQCKTTAKFATQLLKTGTGLVGESKIEIKGGVPQGGVLSPQFFALALDEILNKSFVLRNMIATKELIAYADDICFITQTTDSKIKELDRVLKRHGMNLNASKSIYLGNRESNEATKKSKIKYLGIKMSGTVSQTIVT